nr:SLC13 family permease [Olivibacter sp. SDN3]
MVSSIDKCTTEFVFLGQPAVQASNITLDYKAPLSAMIMLGIVITMAFNWLPAVTAVMFAAILTVLTGCLRNAKAAYRQINWESVLLIGAMLPMSLALEKPGYLVRSRSFW